MTTYPAKPNEVPFGLPLGVGAPVFPTTSPSPPPYNPLRPVVMPPFLPTLPWFPLEPPTWAPPHPGHAGFVWA